MQFAGLNYVFITAIMNTGGRYRKKTVPDVFGTRQGTYSRLQAQFFSYKDLPRPLNNCFLPSEIARLNLEKETGKKSIMLTKYISCRFVEGFFVWM